MLSINSNSQLKFRSSQTNKNTEYNDYTPINENDSADTFELESAETESPIKQNNSRIPKFVRNILLGTALVGGLGAATPKAEAQTVPVGKVITEQKTVNPKDPSKGTATYYYTQENVLDSMVSDYGKLKRIQKFDRKLLNTFPNIKYSYKNIQPEHSFIYNYTVKPMSDETNGYCIDKAPEHKTLSGEKIVDYDTKTAALMTGSRDERESGGVYTPAPPEEPFFNNPALQENVIKKGNQIIKSGRFVDDNTNEPYTVTAYYTERPVLDSVIVKKPDGKVTKTRLDRDVDLKSVTHVETTNPDKTTTNFWLDFDDNNFIKYQNCETDRTYFKDEFVPIKPTPSRKK